MGTELDEFHREFFQDLYSAADADGRYVEDSFFELFCSYLVEAGELDTADRAYYQGQRGLRIDGYGGDPALTEGVLSLVIADFSPSQSVETLTATEMHAIFNRATRFVSQATKPDFRDKLEESTAAFGLADLIAGRWDKITKIRIVLITNRTLSERVDGREAGDVEDKRVVYGVWDLSRLYRYVAAGRGREEIEIDLEADFEGALPVLPAHFDNAGYEAYLAVVPGAQLARIYDRWGVRLLEQNVRVYLQATGKVNKGLRVTLENNPEMFFAYNNGITATAESVEFSDGAEGLRITKLRNLQIVNGGQTTASVHALSLKKDADLSRVFVQMKLSIVDAATAEKVVPKISQYANTQNRVNAADFFANHPFHVRMETFSRRIYAPSPDGTFRESKWFYERARGQFRNARSQLTAAQRKKFDLEYPKSQMFAKTDLAKYLMLWRGLPHTVSKGAQKNFGEFALIIGGEWDRIPDLFNERYYRHAIAKAIVFKAAERLVSEQPWYQGGYRANVVAYAIAKLAHEVGAVHKVVDFDRIWKEQRVSEAMLDALTSVSKAVHDSLTAPPPGSKNVSEWAKKEACWQGVQDLEVKLPPKLLRELISEEEAKSARRGAIQDQQMLNGIEAQTAVFAAGGEFWGQVREWGLARNLLTPTEKGVLGTAAMIPGRVPSEKQSAVALQALAKLQSEGCTLVLHASTETEAL